MIASSPAHPLGTAAGCNEVTLQCCGNQHQPPHIFTHIHRPQNAHGTGGWPVCWKSWNSSPRRRTACCTWAASCCLRQPWARPCPRGWVDGILHRFCTHAQPSDHRQVPACWALREHDAVGKGV